MILDSLANSFDELVVGLPGVWPRNAAVSVERLQDRKRLSDRRAAQLLSREASSAPPPAVSWLTPPHPLDADWRFAASTSDTILDLATSHARGGPLLFLGTPSLAVAADREGVPAILVDKDPLRVRQLDEHLSGVELVEADLHDDELGPVASAVRVAVADPPWYEIEYQSFVRAAANALTIGGHLILVVPAAGTRPGVASEICRLVRYASTAGLVPVDTVVPVARYESPPFEQAALAADELAELPFEWRSGEVLVLSKTQDAGPGPPRCIASMDPEEWVECASLRSRARIRLGDTPGRPGPVLSSLVAGDVLPSVSRRHPLWPVVDVWTTGNRVYGTSAPHRLAAHLTGTGGSPGSDDDELEDAVVAIRGSMALEDEHLREAGWR